MRELLVRRVNDASGELVSLLKSPFFISMKSTIYMHYIIFIIRLFCFYIKKVTFFFIPFEILLFSFPLSLTLLNDMCHEFYRECAGLQPGVIQVF